MIECEKCGAVDHGNAFCSTCRRHWYGGDPLAVERGEIDDGTLRGAFLRLILDEVMEKAVE